MRRHRIIAAAIIVVAMGGSSVALAQTGGSVEPQAPPAAAAPSPCDGHVQEFRSLAKRAWSKDRLDEWTAHPARKGELTQAKQLLTGCARQYGTTSDLRAIWRAKHRAYDRAWEGMIDPPGEGWLASTRSCEEGAAGYATNTGNGFYGAYQFDSGSWAATADDVKRLGMSPSSGTANEAAPREQDLRAALWYRDAGAGAWPNCG